MRVVPLASHPHNLDPVARLIAFGPDGWGIYRVEGGYLACVGPNRCIEELFKNEGDARVAQASWHS
jgi:hypothetical protein